MSSYAPNRDCSGSFINTDQVVTVTYEPAKLAPKSELTAVTTPA